MIDYYFETQEFGVSDEGIHLLRSRFNYETYTYSDIDSLTIERGKELKNWMIVLIAGLGLISFAIWYSLGVIDVLCNNTVRSIYIQEIVIPLLPLMMGIYCIYSATRNGTVLRVKTMKKHNKFALREIEKQAKLEDLKQLLLSKLKARVKINVRT